MQYRAKLRGGQILLDMIKTTKSMAECMEYLDTSVSTDCFQDIDDKIVRCPCAYGLSGDSDRRTIRRPT